MIGKEDRVIWEDLDYTFLKDISRIQPTLNRQWFNQPHMVKQSNMSDEEMTGVGGVGDNDVASSPLTLSQMLSDFFLFYSEFDFKRHGVNVFTGAIEEKRRVGDCLDLPNPMDPLHNTAANIGKKELKLFQESCSVSHRKMTVLKELGINGDERSEASRQALPFAFSQLSYVLSSGEANTILKNVFSKVKQENNKRFGDKRQANKSKKKTLKLPNLRDLFEGAK